MIKLSLSITVNQLVLITARDDISLVCFDLKQQKEQQQQTTTTGSSTTNALLQNGTTADINEELCMVVDVRKDSNEDLRLWLRGYSKTKMAAVTLGFTFFSPLLFVSDLKTRPLSLKVVNSQGKEVGTVKTIIAAKRLRESTSSTTAAKEDITTAPPSTTLSHSAVYKDNASNNLYLDNVHETDRFRLQVHNRLSPKRLDETIDDDNNNSIGKTNETKDGFDARDKTIAELSRSLDESKQRIHKLEEENVRLQAVVNEISKGIDDFIPDSERTTTITTTSNGNNNVDSGEDFLSRFQFQKSAMDRKLALLKARLTNPTGENALVNDNRRLGEELEQTRRVAMVASAEMQRMRRDSEEKERKVVSELQSELTKASDVAVSLVAENKHLSMALDEERQQLAITLDRLRPLDATVVESQQEIVFLKNKLSAVETELSHRKQRFTDEQIDFDERLQIHKNKVLVQLLNSL